MKTLNISSVWHRVLVCFALATALTLPAFGGTLRLTKCRVKAGKTAGEDSIRFSGVLDATQNDLQTAAPAEIVVTIEAAGMPTALDFVFPITNSSYKKGKFKYSRTENASKRSLKFNTKNGKIGFSVKKVNLTGLACPITVTVAAGSSYTAALQVNEDIVNGPKKPCPLQLLMGVQDSLTVAKAKARGRIPSQ